jgi:ABC-type Zn uptake system ZnuABC Zn-binding protein ZnuA
MPGIHHIIQDMNFEYSKYLPGWIVLGLLLAWVAGCERGEASPGSSDGRPVVVAATTMIEDLARQIAGDAVVVQGIMKPGENPHTYHVRPADAAALADADLVLLNGLHLEATLERVLEGESTGKIVRLAKAAGIQPIGSADPTKPIGAPDPHIWMDSQLWSRCAKAAEDAIVSLLSDESLTAGVRARGETYRAELAVLDQHIREQVASLPETNRVLITSHDAFNYYAAAYGIEVHGVVGLSADASPTPGDLQALTELVRRRGVRAVFVETSVSQTINNAVRKLAEDTGIAVGGTLFSDSLGSADEQGGTYIGMMRHNTQQIVDALRGASGATP